jgi:hypothetical protein
MLYVGYRLSFAFGCVGKAVGAGFHYVGHPITEPVSDVLQPRLAALILNSVVKKSRNGQILVATVL